MSSLKLITKEVFERETWDIVTKSFKKSSKEEWFKKLKEILRLHDSREWRIAVLWMVSGHCSPLNFKGKKRMGEAWENNPDYVSQAFRQTFPYTKVSQVNVEDDDGEITDVVKLVISHAVDGLDCGPNIIYLGEEYSWQTQQKELGVTKDNYEEVGAYTTALLCRMILANNWLYNTKSGRHAGQTVPLPSSAVMFCQDKDFPPWVKNSSSSAVLPPFCGIANTAKYIQEAYENAPKESREDLVDELCRPWESRFPGVKASLKSSEFRTSSREIQYKKLESLMTTLRRPPAWTLFAVYPPDHPVLRAEWDRAYGIVEAIDLLAFSGVGNLDMAAIEKVFPEMGTQADLLDMLEKGQGPSNFKDTFFLNGLPLMPQSDDAAEVYGQRVGGTRWGCPGMTEANLENIKKMIGQNASLSEKEAAEMLSRKNFNLPMMQLGRNQNTGAFTTDYVLAPVKVTEKYFLSLSKAQMRGKKGGAAGRKRKAVERAAETAKKLKAVKELPKNVWLSQYFNATDGNKALKLKWKTFISNYIDQLDFGDAEKYLKSPKIEPFLPDIKDKFKDSKNENNNRYLEMLIPKPKIALFYTTLGIRAGAGMFNPGSSGRPNTDPPRGRSTPQATDNGSDVLGKKNHVFPMTILAPGVTQYPISEILWKNPPISPGKVDSARGTLGVMLNKFNKLLAEADGQVIQYANVEHFIAKNCAVFGVNFMMAVLRFHYSVPVMISMHQARSAYTGDNPFTKKATEEYLNMFHLTYPTTEPPVNMQQSIIKDSNGRLV